MLHDIDKQYNSMHALLKDQPSVTRQECIYSPYLDTGIFGHCLFGSPSPSLPSLGQLLPTLFGTQGVP